MNERQFIGMLEGALEVATDEDSFPVERIRRERKILHLRVDVTDLPQREIDALAMEMIVQGEQSDEYFPPGEDVPELNSPGHRSVYVAAAMEVEFGPFVQIDGTEFRLLGHDVTIR